MSLPQAFQETTTLDHTYKVRDAGGRVVALHVREDKADGSKEVRWKQPNGSWGLNGTRLADLPLYGAECVSGWDPDALIVLCEGEKAADALTAAGLKAVGSVTGASGTPGEGALEVLRDWRVCLWPDNDEPGHRHMARIAEKLSGVAAEVLVYAWDEATEHGDAADHPAVLSQSPKAVDRLLTNLESSPRWKPRPEPSVYEGRDQSRRLNPGFNLTDLGNAERLIAQHGDNLRYSYAWGRWLAWDGRRWAVDDCGAVELLAKKAVRRLYSEAADAEDSARRKELADHARRSESQSRIAAMIALARSEPSVPIQPGELDADPWLLNVENGTLDLRSGQLRPHRREALITKLSPVEYDPDAEAPVWEAFLERVLPSEALRRFIQRLAGYALTGDVSEQVLPFLCGSGANGKTTFLTTLLEVAGDYGTQAAPDLLLAKRDSHPTELADLFGARLVASVEVADGRQLAEGLVKQLTGGDRIKARRMREDFWEFSPTHKVFLAANHKPEVKGTDHAMWRRIKLVPFDVTIPKAEQDPRLPEKLRGEGPGVLSWAVRGCLEWRTEGLGEPEEVRSATEGYRHEQDVLAGWIEERCLVGAEVSAKFKDLYTDYRQWAEESGEKPLNKMRLGLRLSERGFENTRGAGNAAIRRGIALLHDGPEPPRVNGSHCEQEPESHESRQKQAETVTQVKSREETVNGQSTCKSEGFDERVNSSYPETGINGHKYYVRPLYRKSVNNHSPINPKDPAVSFEESFEETATVEPHGAEDTILRRVRAAFEKPGGGPAKNLPHYHLGACDLETLYASVLYELRIVPSRDFEPGELSEWTEAIASVAEERRR